MTRSGLAILASACALLFAQPAFAATTRYASPTGSGTTCSDALPCDLVGAMTGALSGDSVILGPGTYNLATGLLVPPGVSLIGAAGERPTITSSIPATTVALQGGAVKHLAITQAAGAAFYAITSAAGSTVDDVVVTSNGSGASISPTDVIRNSVIRLTGDSGTGISANGLGAADVRNVLISAPGSTTQGIVAAGVCIPMIVIDPGTGLPMPGLCMPMPQPSVNVRNSIIRAATDAVGTGTGIAVGTVTLAYSDYRPAKTLGSVIDGGGNIEGEPLFADAANGDFRPLAGSPTIDAGDPAAATDALVGSLDLAGLARIVGDRIDMGPFEFVPGGGASTDTGTQQGGGSDTGTPPAEQTPPATQGNPPAPDKTAPVVKSLRFAPGTLRKSALVSYLVSERATTTLSIVRKTTGVKKGRTCAKAGRKIRKGAKRCTRWVLVRGSINRADAGGRSSFRFNGKLRGKRLAVGSYRLVAIARDAAGNVGKPVTVAFRVSAARSKA